MAGRNFNELLKGQWEQGKFLCVGLDPDLEKIPASVQGKDVGERIFNFNRAIIDATLDVAAAYKPNSAFYEGSDEGFAALRETIAYIHDAAPGIPVILDFKRADIGNTNRGYVESAFEFLKADAITVPPYLGSEALAPFLEREEKGVFVLCRTSNSGAGEFQDLVVNNEPLYIVVARRVADWNIRKNCGLVVGATYPEELKKIRTVALELPILIPGVGAQKGDLRESVRAGKDTRGSGVIISVSRAVTYASDDSDFAKAARKAAEEFDREIQAALIQ